MDEVVPHAVVIAAMLETVVTFAAVFEFVALGLLAHRALRRTSPPPSP